MSVLGEMRSMLAGLKNALGQCSSSDRVAAHAQVHHTQKNLNAESEKLLLSQMAFDAELRGQARRRYHIVVNPAADEEELDHAVESVVMGQVQTFQVYIAKYPWNYTFIFLTLTKSRGRHKADAGSKLWIRKQPSSMDQWQFERLNKSSP